MIDGPLYLLHYEHDGTDIVCAQCDHTVLDLAAPGPDSQFSLSLLVLQMMHHSTVCGPPRE